jgi:hypothetical protein
MFETDVIDAKSKIIVSMDSEVRCYELDELYRPEILRMFERTFNFKSKHLDAMEDWNGNKLGIYDNNQHPDWIVLANCENAKCREIKPNRIFGPWQPVTENEHLNFLKYELVLVNPLDLFWVESEVYTMWYGRMSPKELLSFKTHKKEDLVKWIAIHEKISIEDAIKKLYFLKVSCCKKFGAFLARKNWCNETFTGDKSYIEKKCFKFFEMEQRGKLTIEQKIKNQKLMFDHLDFQKFYNHDIESIFNNNIFHLPEVLSCVPYPSGINSYWPKLERSSQWIKLEEERNKREAKMIRRND